MSTYEGYFWPGPITYRFQGKLLDDMDGDFDMQNPVILKRALKGLAERYREAQRAIDDGEYDRAKDLLFTDGEWDYWAVDDGEKGEVTSSNDETNESGSPVDNAEVVDLTPEGAVDARR